MNIAQGATAKTPVQARGDASTSAGNRQHELGYQHKLGTEQMRVQEVLVQEVLVQVVLVQVGVHPSVVCAWDSSRRPRVLSLQRPSLRTYLAKAHAEPARPQVQPVLIPVLRVGAFLALRGGRT